MIYIRHSEKLYKNGHNIEYPFDPGLTDTGKINALVKFTELLKYGIPTKIYCSPYLRTRETAIISQYVVKQYANIDVEIIIDALLSEYLGNQKNVNFKKDVRIETSQYNPPLPENWRDYINRLKKHINNTNIKQNIINNNIIWYITHGLVIKNIAFLNGFKIKYPSTLGGFIKVNNNYYFN